MQIKANSSAKTTPESNSWPQLKNFLLCASVYACDVCVCVCVRAASCMCAIERRRERSAVFVYVDSDSLVRGKTKKTSEMNDVKGIFNENIV